MRIRIDVEVFVNCRYGTTSSVRLSARRASPTFPSDVV
jgi:hypothetical protein